MFKKIYSFLTLLTAFLWLGTGTMWGETLKIGTNSTYTTNSPVWGNKANNYVMSQVIYPASSLTALEGKQITKLTFYTRSGYASNVVWNNMNVRITERDATSTFASTTDWEDISTISPLYTGQLNATGSTMEITLSEPYVYYGGNLVIDIRNSAKTNASSSGKPRFQASTASNSVLYDYNSSSSTPTSWTELNNKRPDVMFTYEDAPSAGGCPTPSNIAFSNKTYNSVSITWNGGTATSWNLQYKQGTGAWTPDIPIVCTDPSCNLSGLTTGVPYTVRVQASSCTGGEWAESDELTLNYTAPAPSATSYTEVAANIGWEAVSDANGYKYIYAESGQTPDWDNATTSTTPSASLTGLTGATSYTFYACSTYPSGNSDTATVNFTTQKIAPAISSEYTATATTATFTWTANGSAVGQYQWKTNKAGSDWSAATSELTATETGLTAGTNYTFYVRRVYGDNKFSSDATLQFATECVNETLPFETGFEEDLSACWSMLRTNANFSLPTVSTSSHYEGAKSLYFNGSGSTSKSVAVLPAFAKDIKKLQISFYYKCSTNNNRPRFGVGYVTNKEDISTYEQLKTLDRTSSFANTGEIELTEAAEGSYIAICYYGGSDDAAGYVDNIVVSVIPSCGKPSALATTAVSKDGATITWTAGNDETAWNLQYKQEGGSWSANQVVETNPTFDLEGLEASTTYFVRVQAACDGEWSDELSFTTWCDSKLSLPLELTSFSAVPTCWEVSPAGAVSIASSKLCFVGEGERFLYLPQTNIDLNLLSATFTFSGNLEFGYIDAPGGAFHAFATQPTTGVELDLVDEADAPKYIAIRYNGASSLSQSMISAISIRKTPTCTKPAITTPITVTTNSATIAWTNSNATAWKLQYKTGSDDWTEVAVSENPSYTLEGLAQGTTYKVRVQGACTDEDSDWSDEAQFETLCETINALPFEETFDAALSACWNITDEETTTYAHYVYGGELRLPGGKAASGHLVVLPEFTVSLANATMTIEYSASTDANTAVPQVGYIDGDGNFQQLKALDKSLTEDTIHLAGAMTGKLALRYDDGTSEGNFDIASIRVSRLEVFNDDEDNETRLAALKTAGETIDVIFNRTLIANHDYNTFCLPFSLDADQLAASPLANFKLKAFDFASIENEELLIVIADASTIEAGKPYFVANNEDEVVTKQRFQDVVITASTPGQDANGDLIFKGVFNPKDLAAQAETDAHNQLFLAAGNKIYWPAQNKTVKGFRAYFEANVTSGMLHIKPGMPARIVERTQTPTGCENVQSDSKTQKFIENNQVVIIRNGVKYNIQGQVIQ